jgi:hypothetical protein
MAPLNSLQQIWYWGKSKNRVLVLVLDLHKVFLGDQDYGHPLLWGRIDGDGQNYK